MESKPLTLKILDVVAILVLIAATYMALNAPTERVMGEVQKVFYFHIGTAWTALLGFILAAVFGGIPPRFIQPLWSTPLSTSRSLGTVAPQ